MSFSKNLSHVTRGRKKRARDYKMFYCTSGGVLFFFLFVVPSVSTLLLLMFLVLPFFLLFLFLNFAGDCIVGQFDVVGTKRKALPRTLC